MKLELLAFAEWLRAQPDDSLVGVSGDCFYGPLSRWLEETTGQRWVVSWDADSYRPSVSSDWRPVPLWAALFHWWVECHLEAYKQVPKALALSVLQEVAEELLEEGWLWMLESGQSAIG